MTGGATIEDKDSEIMGYVENTCFYVTTKSLKCEALVSKGQLNQFA